MFLNILDALRFVLSLDILSTISTTNGQCDTPQDGYQCETGIMHFLGQYSPFFTVPSDISPETPPHCEITFVQALSRHGARYPTGDKRKTYSQTIAEIKANVTAFDGLYSFLSDYTFALGQEQLTPFGEEEMINSGIQFVSRYRELIATDQPFIRAGSTERVVCSAQNWIQGYQQESGNSEVIPILVIEDGPKANNTLNHGLCKNFEDSPISNAARNVKIEFAEVFVPDIQHRLNADLPGANLTISQTIDLMDLCSYETVASPDASIISPFCMLFSEEEWRLYNYYQTLDKYFGRGLGNPLGPTQGVGFVNELIARMTNTSVIDHTSVNHTLDDDPATFPIGRKVYADFSHDNDMTGMFFALGLYNDTERLFNETASEADSEESQGYSAAWTVPFAARAYFEKMQCQNEAEELVRVIINGRVVPLVGCGTDSRGMCTLSNFVESQSFARAGGLWNEC